jgi:D-arabinose 1-dehydrogenase-like Zn-dependent alcohol dehydrogenase
LAKAGKIKHRIQKFPLSEINEAIQLLRNGQIVRSGVIFLKIRGDAALIYSTQF